MSVRNNRNKVLNNNIDFYSSFIKKRNIKAIKHFATPIMTHPTIEQRASIPTEIHIWTYGDRFYKLADTYYSDPNMWWVIAWYNGIPTEADVLNGDAIYIPLSLSDALIVLGV